MVARHGYFRDLVLGWSRQCGDGEGRLVGSFAAPAWNAGLSVSSVKDEKPASARVNSLSVDTSTIIRMNKLPRTASLRQGSAVRDAIPFLFFEDFIDVSLQERF